MGTIFHMTTCTEHLSCLIPATLHITDVELVETTGYSKNGREGHPVTRVTLQGRVLGSIRDDGFEIHPNHGGGWRADWSVFSGGQCLPTGGRVETTEAAVRVLVEHCARSSFHWRMALHS